MCGLTTTLRDLPVDIFVNQFFKDGIFFHVNTQFIGDFQCKNSIYGRFSM